MQKSGFTVAITDCGVTPQAQNTGSSSPRTSTASPSGFGPRRKSGTVYITHNQDSFLFYLTWTQYVSAAIWAIRFCLKENDCKRRRPCYGIKLTSPTA